MKKYGFLTSVTVLAAALTSSGCATHLQAPKKKFQQVIPVPCIDRMVKFLKGTTCVAIDRKPDYARCRGGMEIHFTCTKAVAE